MAQEESSSFGKRVSRRVEFDFEHAVHLFPALLWTAEPDGWVDFLNDRWLEYTGLSLEEATGWGWQDALHDDDRPDLLSIWQGLLVAGQAGEAEARLRRFDGVYRWFLFSAVPTHGDDGRPIKWHGQTTDIEDRKCAVALLAAEKRLLELVAQGTPLPVMLTTVCKHIEVLVPGALATVLLVDRDGERMLYGAAPSLPESMMQAVADCRVRPDGGPCARAAFSGEPVFSLDVAADNMPERLRDIVVSAGLKTCSCIPIVSSDGRVLGTFALYRREAGPPTPQQDEVLEQFTHLARIAIERRQADESLRRNERYLAEAQRLSHTGSFSWNPDTGEVLWSDEVYRIYAMDLSTKITLDLAVERCHPDDVEHFKRVAGKAAASKSDLSFTHRILLPDGAVKFLEVEARAVHDAAGRFLEYVGAVKDVTEQRLSDLALLRMQEELAHVTRVATLGELTASIAHELNQPLTGVVLNANASLRWLAAGTADLDEVRQATNRILRDGKRAGEVIARLRALFGKADSVKEPVDLNESVGEVLVLARGEMQSRQVALRTEWAEDLPVVLADKVQLQQVALNLLINAVESVAVAEGRGAAVIVRTARQGDSEVCVSVRDNGIGIEPALVDRIFDPFYTSKAEGMGMGLAISRSIIESHGGRLWVERNDGPGCTFCFTVSAPPYGSK